MPRSGHAHAHSVTNGFTPGGHIPAGYSYLDRAHSLVTPTRRSLPQGMAGTPSSTDESRGSSIAGDTSSEVSPARLRHADSMPDVSSVVEARLASAPPPPAVNRKCSMDNSLRISLSPSAPADLVSIVDLVARLPADPRTWMPSHVALYLTQVLGLTPKLIVDDVTAYVRNARMSGRAFLRLREKDLAAEGLNLKWRRLMIAAVKKLRRDCIRAKLLDLGGDNDGDEDAAEEEKIITPSPAFAKGTLKRLRDKQAVRGMIHSFENIGDGGHSTDSDETHAPRLLKRSSVSSLFSSGGESPGGSPAARMAAIYGEGYVRDRAASFSSPQAECERKPYAATFTRQQLESWFGDLTEQEANALADELEADQPRGKREDRRSSSSSRHSHSSSLSGVDSALLTPTALEVCGFDLTPIDTDTVDAIVMSRSTDELGQVSPSTKSPPPQHHDYTAPLRKDVLTDYEASDELYDVSAANDVPRPSGWGQGHVNPYRRSTYEPQDLEALGLEYGSRTFKFDTAKKMPRTIEDSSMVQRGPAQDSIRIRKSPAAPPSDFRSMFSESTETPGELDGAQSSADIMAARREQSDGSVREEVAPLSSRTVGGNSVRKTATFGRTALAAALAKVQVEEGDNYGGKRAENEREWGVTVSRKASRRNTLARSEAAPSVEAAHTKEGSAAARMSQLFSPTSIALSSDNLQKHDAQLASNIVDETPDEAPRNRNSKILVPLAAIEVDADGNKSIGKTSMVLVDRRRFEALAKRMGMLEEQLVGLESASLPPDSDLDALSSMSEKVVQARMALDQVFASMPVEFSKDAASVSEEDPLTTPGMDENDTRRWRLVESLGAIPSYGELTEDVHTVEPRGTLAVHWLNFCFRMLKVPGLFSRIPRPFLPVPELALGLAAGAGFVLLSEVFGRSRR